MSALGVSLSSMITLCSPPWRACLVSTSLCIVSTPRHLLTASLAFPQHLPASADMLGLLLEGGDWQDPEEGGPSLPLEEDAPSLGKGSCQKEILCRGTGLRWASWESIWRALWI